MKFLPGQRNNKVFKSNWFIKYVNHFPRPLSVFSLFSPNWLRTIWKLESHWIYFSFIVHDLPKYVVDLQWTVSCQNEYYFSFFFSLDPIFIDFGRIPHWNCPVEGQTEETQPDVYSESKKIPSVDRVDDLDSEPSINTRRKYKGEG